MRIGAFVMGTRGGDYAAMLDQVERCEQLGFDTVVLAEHLAAFVREAKAMEVQVHRRDWPERAS